MPEGLIAWEPTNQMSILKMSLDRYYIAILANATRVLVLELYKCGMILLN